MLELITNSSPYLNLKKVCNLLLQKLQDSYRYFAKKFRSQSPIKRRNSDSELDTLETRRSGAISTSVTMEMPITANADYHAVTLTEELNVPYRHSSQTEFAAICFSTPKLSSSSNDSDMGALETTPGLIVPRPKPVFRSTTI